MPKISSPTLAEHQARQRRALVAAAVAILADGGVGALTPASAGRRASLARSSTYQYFDSGAALVAAAVEAAQAEVDGAVIRATGDAESSDGVIAAYISTLLALATTVPARAVRALGHAELPPMCAARLRELADAQREPLVAALVTRGVPDPAGVAALVAAAVDAGAARVAAGEPVDAVRAQVLGLVFGGVDGH